MTDEHKETNGHFRIVTKQNKCLKANQNVRI
jgi:hypothetical protein